ncbi:type III restriction endonuclease subunit R [Spirochaetia bacterium]|nr:type III restriction endonuclease subunit R [Spirochaetia bacterium]
MSPEAKARKIIDEKLAASGWLLQDYKGEFNPAAAPGVAVREFPTTSGPADYMLFVGKTPVAVVEAKKSGEGQNITVAETQNLRYANSSLKWRVPGQPIRFVYEATDILTRFTDYADEDERSREVFSFHRPQTLLAWIKKESTLRNRLISFPEFNSKGFRDCQTRAIINLENSFAANKPRALVQMATGAGKTFAAITSVYRLLTHAKAKRILFLVDTKNLGQQAEQEFLAYTPNDDPRRFSELYNVRRLNSPYIPADSHVCISTIQRMYSILRGEAMDESLEEESPNEYEISGDPREVTYNEKYPPEFFDFIIIDECHRSIYNIWQQVLDYFDAFLIGLTATPDKRTFGFFNENIVSEYSHEQAVIDNVNVGYDVYLIKTEIGKKGAAIPKQLIERRERLSRKKRWEQLDEDIVYSKEQLDRDVVNPSQIRNVIKAFKDGLSAMFPGRKEIPKTIIFAKTDSHADDIIQIAREEFGLGNDFCRKITYSVDRADGVLANFRNDYNPRIAVTVDMIATGTDVKPVECLVFMRDVRSRSYFEQMKGRGTRTFDQDSLRKVTPSAASNKTHFIIVDAVGVTKSLKTDSRPLERKPAVTLKDLMMSLVMGSRDEDVFLSLANRLTRLDKELSPAEQEKYAEHSQGTTLRSTVQKILDVFNADHIEEQARKDHGLTADNEISEEQLQQVQKAMAEEAAQPFYLPALRTFIEDARKAHDQIIDTVNIDKINVSAWDKQHSENAGKTIAAFKEFISAHKDNIIALSIIYNQSWKNRPLTLDMIEELYNALQKPPYNLAINLLWQAYETTCPEKVKPKSPERMLSDIVTLLRFELGIDKDLRPFSDMVDANFRDWVFSQNAGHIHFTGEQMNWLRMIKDFIAASLCITRDDLSLSPFDGSGGLGRFYELFGDGYEKLLDEMNLALTA